jgi:RecA-family ATPase
MQGRAAGQSLRSRQRRHRNRSGPLTGPTGEGKTSVALLIALHVDQGWPVEGRDIDKGKVLFLAGENPDDVRMRWIKFLDEQKLDEKDVNVVFVPGSFALSDKVMRDRIVQANKDHGPFDLIIVDTSAAFFEGDDENTNPQMLAHAKR